jgi:CRP-like cAMP-binding protein
VKVSVLSKKGKEATLALLGPGDFLGEACIASDQRFRTATATAIADCSLLRIERDEMIRLLHEQRAISELFVSYLLSRNRRIQEDLIDQLFNSSEKRLARALLLLARFGKEQRSKTVIPKISQQALAEMIGTTRPRVSFFLNRFRKMGFIDYNGELQVHSSLISVVLRG